MNNEQPLRLTNFLLAVASVFVIIFGIQLSAPILNPIVLALVITVAVLPLPGWLARRGLPAWLALGLTVLAVVGGLALLILLVVGSMTRLTTQLPSYVDDIAARSAELTTWLQNSSGFQGIDSSLLIGGAGIILGGAVNILVATALTLLIFFFMLTAAVSFSRRSPDAVTTDAPALRRISELTEEVRQYVTITTVINLLVGLGDTILLLILGVDFAILWGILSWVLGYIPSVGFWLALIPPALLAWAESGPRMALAVFVGYVLINGTVENFVKPKMMGEGLRISPVIVVVSLFVWGWLLGAVGALLAIPLTLLVLSILDSFESTRWLIVLIRPTPEKGAEERGEAQRRLGRLWQRVRLVTGDEEPAHTNIE